MTKIFIDGSAGTTGLRIYDRLSTREDISLITLPENLRKDDNARADAINSADIVFLCLPDDAARQAVSFAKNDKKCVKLMRYNGIDISKASEFVGIFRAVLFTPDHLELVKGVPEQRRNFIDMAICQIQPKYIAYLNEYGRVLNQRNAFLKNCALSGKFDDTLFDIINQKLSVCAASVSKQRAGFCKLLNEKAGRIYSGISGESERLFIKYSSNAKCSCEDVDKTAEKYMKLFSDSKESDLRQMVTHNGIQRDDLQIYISKNETDDEDYIARSFASQGQIRSGVLALKLSEGEIIKEITGQYPVFLLDDLFSELDSRRRSFLLKTLEGRQVVITGCERLDFENTDVNTIRVENGTYYSEKEQ
jgi:DNA replication and repair protein RecF